MRKVCFSERKGKNISFFSNKNKASFSLCITHHRGATLSLFHEKEVKEVKEDSKEFIDVRRASETASKSAARRVMFALGRYEMYYLFSLFFPSSCEKSTRFRYTFFMMRCARFVRFCSAM